MLYASCTNTAAGLWVYLTPDRILLSRAISSPKVRICTLHSSVSTLCRHRGGGSCSTYPQELGTTELGCRSQPWTFNSTRNMAYGGGKGKKNHASRVSPSSVPSLLEGRSTPLHNADETQLRLSHLIQPPRSNPCLMTTSNTSVSWTSIVCSSPSSL